jgi:hypothetical protein
MNRLSWLVVCAAVFLGSALGSTAAAKDPLGEANPLPASLERKVQDLRYDLEASGFETARGYWQLWTAEDCKFPLQTVGTCYGNNPTAPYVLAMLPHWDDEFVDRSMQHALAQGRRDMTPNYRLGEREALVILAEIPPPARYFGMATNVFTREDKLNENDPVYQILHDQPDLQAIIFEGSHNVVIEQQSGESWGQQRFIVVTPDEDMAVALTEALVALDGVEADHVFVEPVSPYLVRTGYGAEADDLISYIRYSMPNDDELGEKWRKELPLTILRVREPDNGAARMPFDIPEYEPKTANIDEHAFEADLANLVTAVKEYWDQDVPARSLQSLSLWVDLIGQHCLGHDGPPAPVPEIELPRGPMNCLGDSQDADYQISASHLLDSGEVVAVIGTLGTQTGNATYTSLSVNWFPALVGVLNRDDPVLEESAQKFRDALVNPYTKFYVYYFARDCTGLYPWCKEVPRTLVARGETIKILQRNYINPGTRRGADPRQILNPVTIEFDGTKRPTVQ